MAKKYVGPRRPIDKRNINMYTSPVISTQDEQNLFTSTVAETLIRLVGNVVVSPDDAQTVGARVAFAIILAREGSTVSTLSVSDGQVLYEPEQDVLFSLVDFTEDHLTAGKNFPVDVKGQRKMKEGDQIKLINIGSSASNSGRLFANITGFVKQ